MAYYYSYWRLFWLVIALVFPRNFANLLVFNLTEDQINASFAVKDGEYNVGIYIHATRQGYQVSSAEGECLVSMKILQDGSSQLMSILDECFLQFQGRDYVIHKRFATKNELNNTTDYIRTLLEASSSTEFAELNFKIALQSLHERPESDLILQASVELGGKGITASNHPQLLPLYMFATHLSQLARFQPQNDTRHNKDIIEECGEPYKDDECIGMCGNKCHCWKFICGDCCRHNGCLEHDLCCLQDFYSSYCLFPHYYGFSCSGFGGYPKCGY